MKLWKFFEELFSFVPFSPEVRANELTAFQAALIRLKAHMKSSLLAASLFPLKILFFITRCCCFMFVIPMEQRNACRWEILGEVSHSMSWQDFSPPGKIYGLRRRHRWLIDVRVAFNLRLGVHRTRSVMKKHPLWLKATSLFLQFRSDHQSSLQFRTEKHSE